MDVLVNGAQQVEVAVRYGVTRQTVSEAVIRVREVLLGGGVCPLCLHKMEGGESAA
jgi:transposase-like protein